ncbi:MAG: hypothetical protein BYD32DRAFT_402828 [Podila humilis]|nr:MAG: hypothetical protein BYD32DRAFT_402828 [Podila humilis]
MVHHYACSMHTMHATSHRSKIKSESRHHALGTCTCFLEVGGGCLSVFFTCACLCTIPLYFPFIIVYCILFFAPLFFSPILSSLATNLCALVPSLPSCSHVGQPSVCKYKQTFSCLSFSLTLSFCSHPTPPHTMMGCESTHTMANSCTPLQDCCV